MRTYPCLGTCVRLAVLSVRPIDFPSHTVIDHLLHYRYTHPIQVAWCSRNSGAVASRTVNASVYNMFVQASAVVAAQVYRKDDAPQCKSSAEICSSFDGHYAPPDRRGNAVLISISCFNIFIMYPSIKMYYIWRNKQRSKIWDAMSPTACFQIV